MKLEIEQLMGESKKFNDILKKSIKVRNEKQEKNYLLEKKSKLKRINNIDKPFSKIKHITGMKVYIGFRLLMKLSTRLSGARNIILNEPKHIDDGRPVIFVSTHVSKYDIETVMQTLKKHVHLLSGTEDRMLRTIEGLLLKLNGVNFVDRADSFDRKLSVKKMNKDLQNGVNLLIFPEGTLNLSQNILIQPISYSIIELALKNNAAIELVTVDKEGKLLFTNYGGRFSINILRKTLKPIYNKINELEDILNDKEKSIEYINKVKEEIVRLENIKKELLISETIKLRDALATLKWETMIYKEEYLQTKIEPEEYKRNKNISNNSNMDYNYYTKRSDLPDDYWSNTLCEILEEWLMADLLEEDDYILKPKGEPYQYFEEFNSSEKIINGQKIKKRISSEGRYLKK